MLDRLLEIYTSELVFRLLLCTNNFQLASYEFVYVINNMNGKCGYFSYGFAV